MSRRPKLSRAQEGDFVVEGRVQTEGDFGGEVVCEVEVDALEERGGGGDFEGLDGDGGSGDGGSGGGVG